jgi:hypothetical protein
MSDLKDSIARVINELKGLEERARGLQNQNLADIAASAHNRVKQLHDHPDLELVDERKDRTSEGTAATGHAAAPSPEYPPPASASFPQSGPGNTTAGF